jgi:hypothetical protein
MRRLAVLAALLVGCGLPGRGQAGPEPGSTPADALKSFLRGSLRRPGEPADDTTLYSYAFVDLDGRGSQEVIVYVSGRNWCGSGGCTTLVLARAGSSYRVVGRIPITWLPIRVLDTRSNGWHDIAVRVRGGGIRPGYESALPFNGRSYPNNPTVPPARPLGEKSAGQIVLSDENEAKPLYK